MNSVNPGYIPTQMPPLGFGQLTNLSQYQEWELRSRRREADRKIVDAYNQMEGATGGVIGTANPDFSAAMQPGEIPSGGVQPTSDSSKAAIDGSRNTQAVQPNVPPKPSGVAGADPDLMTFPQQDFLSGKDTNLDKFNDAFADISQRWGMDGDDTNGNMSDVSGISDASTASNPFDKTYDELMKKYEDGHDEIFGNATAHLGGSWL